MSGKSSRRAELYPIIARMREKEKLQFKDIGARLGLSKYTVSDYYHDPNGARVLARKRKASCESCDKPVRSDCNPPSRYCLKCERWIRHENARDRVIIAIQEWNKRYGHPPGASDWNPALAERLGQFDGARRYREERCWPSTTTVQRAFGSWNEAIRQAGFEALPSGHRRKEEK
jgi:transcriptional regulator with XRE-family HTH domain